MALPCLIFDFFFVVVSIRFSSSFQKKPPKSNDPPEIKIKGLTFASAHAMSVLRETHWKDQPAGGGSNDSELTTCIYINLVTFDLRQKNIELALQVCQAHWVPNMHCALVPYQHLALFSFSPSSLPSFFFPYLNPISNSNLVFDAYNHFQHPVLDNHYVQTTTGPPPWLAAKVFGMYLLITHFFSSLI